jgi:hypothetical protein
MVVSLLLKPRDAEMLFTHVQPNKLLSVFLPLQVQQCWLPMASISLRRLVICATGALRKLVGSICY